MSAVSRSRVAAACSASDSKSRIKSSSGSISMAVPFVICGRVETPLHHVGGLPPITSFAPTCREASRSPSHRAGAFFLPESVPERALRDWHVGGFIHRWPQHAAAARAQRMRQLAQRIRQLQLVAPSE